MDTIVALATPPGVSGIAVIRISGDDAINIANQHFIRKNKLADAKSHTIHYGKFVNNESIIDLVTASVFRNPHSYTGEDVVEISCHGGFVIYEEIINALLSSGCRLAKPGEFTQRAFINGKLDLLQAESVADLIHSNSIISEQVSTRQLLGNFTQRIQIFKSKLIKIAGLLELELDFSDEDIDLVSKQDIIIMIDELLNFNNEIIDSFNSAQILHNGFAAAIVGYPNSGKSTLFNKLLNKDRAIVSPIPGTTRDYLEEYHYYDGIAVKLFDTAGIRDTDDIVEIVGIKLVESVIKQSNLIFVINDASNDVNYSDKLFDEIKQKYENKTYYLLQNKVDISPTKPRNIEEIEISAKTEINLNTVKDVIAKIAKQSISRVNDILVNERQYNLLKQINIDLTNARQSIENNYQNEFIAIDVRNAIKKLGELTGEIYNEDILNQIFSSFCIGK